MTSNIKYGIKKERKVAQVLRSRGARVETSKGSKGAADLKARWSSGTKWHVQVKSSRTSKPSSLSRKELGRLKQGATKAGATPVIARVTLQGVEYLSARTGRNLKPPKTR